MPFHTIAKKGINHFIVSNSVPDDKLSTHITIVEPGKRAHPPHVHGGVEAFYMLEGEGTMETEGEKQVLRANDIIVLDPTKEHGLVNTGNTPMRYMVIIAQ
jgi:mannose-6-phosphate isomerase-like protein (cupin superfamily)